MTARIRQFFEDNPHLPTPFVALDLDVVEENHKGFRVALPLALIHYAVKANPHPAILQRLADLGSSFDCASVAEIKMVLACGVDPSRISYGNTIKKERDIAEAYSLGIRLFATDSEADLLKLRQGAPSAEFFCRILTSGEGAEWPLSRKFGCSVGDAVELLLRGQELDLFPRGVSFHVGSQMTNPNAWKPALVDAKAIFDAAAVEGIPLDLINMGGGFPSRYTKDIPDAQAYGQAIMAAVHEVFGEDIPQLIIEPGRGMVGNAGIIKSEVVLVSQRSMAMPQWVYVDIGKFGGLAETMDEAIRYKISTDFSADQPLVPSILAGPTCDSADVLYERTPYLLPRDLNDGHHIYIEGTGAYTTTYSAISFNGFEPLAAYVID